MQLSRDVTNMGLSGRTAQRAREESSAHAATGARYTLEDIVGQSPEIQEVRRLIQRIANSSSSVLVYGETGTGKELVVSSIHNASYRKDKTFMPINCAALPESILESLLFGNGDRLPTILIGCGRLGKAVSRFITTDTNGYKLIAAFDVAENEVGKEISGIRIRHIDELEAFCEENKPKVAVLCVPRDGAEQVSGRLVDLGIEGFWNFSHYDLSVSYPDVVVENVHLGDSLMSLGYRLRNQE